jgi:hypothetical protein
VYPENDQQLKEAACLHPHLKGTFFGASTLRATLCRVNKDSGHGRGQKMVRKGIVIS